jgi:hypothetical protein
MPASRFRISRTLGHWTVLGRAVRRRVGAGTRRLLTLGIVLAVTAGLSAWIAPASQAAASNHSPVSSLDTIGFVNGKIHLSGWAYDPDGRNSLAVEVRIDGKLATRLRASINRPDVAAHYPRYGAAHGFEADIAATDGRHTVCVAAYNIGPGSNRNVGCRTVIVNNNPIGGLDTPLQLPQGVQVSGWTLDPNTKGSITAILSVDGNQLTRLTASLPRASTAYPYYGNTHGFSTFANLTAGLHRICLTAVNVGSGTKNPELGCKNVTVNHDPVGVLDPPGRPGGSGMTATVTGYALDLDSAAPIQVQVSVDGVAQPVQPANQPSSAAATAYPQFTQQHGFALTVAVPDGNQHRICVTFINVGLGADHGICQPLLSNGDLTPSPPIGVTAFPGNTSTVISWSPARSVSSPVSYYTVTGLPQGRVLQVSATTAQVSISGLRNGSSYTFAVRAYNSLGAGSSAPISATPSLVPPQFTPAPISTSHYPRNLTGNLAVDTAAARAQGARDADANPSNHRYLVLQDVGGQDMSRGGVVLSATSIFRSYADVLAVMEAYTDGYASRQRLYAPLTLAVGTNNDIDVSYQAGQTWATQVINPLNSYVSATHPGISIAGADDIEPGFSATAAESRSWLGGYLSASSAKFVFNGSADGCSTVAASSHCNNGWTMADLQWLSGGAAPTRIIDLPQIYNGSMPLQWKFISLTGVQDGLARIYFGGPLTEYTACGGGRKCYSITGNDAWSRLWGAISSAPSTAQYDMPYSTDLMVN